jgi:MFS family permease
MALGAMFIIIGTVIQCTSLAAFMGGRFLLGFGVATSVTAGPAYVSEIAHPAFRGTMMGLYNVLWFDGGIPGTFIPWKTSQIEGTMYELGYPHLASDGLLWLGSSLLLLLPEVRAPLGCFYNHTGEMQLIWESPQDGSYPIASVTRRYGCSRNIMVREIGILQSSSSSMAK